MSAFRQFVEQRFALVLLLSCVAGLALPPLAHLPTRSAVMALAALMFLSCYRLADGGLEDISWRSVFRFWGWRYLALPLALWFAANHLCPHYATGVFLLSMLPAGVASPAFAGIYGGAVAPAFAVVIVSQLATPLVIPLQFALIGSGGTALMPSPGALFMTMVWCIFLPIGIYAVARAHRPSADYFCRENKFFSVLLVAFVIALAIAKQRSVILSHGFGLAGTLGITLLCFACYIVFGWLMGHEREEKIAFAACSSFNNAALGVSLALLHFPPPVVLFVAVSEVGWAMLPMMMRIALSIL